MKKMLIFATISIVLLVTITLLINKKENYYKNQISQQELKQNLLEKKEKVIYFYQTNCSHCLKISPIIVPMAKDMDINMEVLNIENEIDPWKDYNIKGTPTIIHYKDGEEQSRIMGEKSEETFKKWFEQIKKSS